MINAQFSRYKLPVDYYVYAYIDENNIPYYIGMGQGLRAWASHKQNNTQLLPVDRTKIQIIAHRLSKDEANLLETKLISYYGRKSISTGVLVNITSGGTNSHEFTLTEEQCKRKQEITLANWKDEQYKNKTIERIRIGTNTPEAKINYSIAHTKQWHEKREKIITAQKKAHLRPEVKQNKSKVVTARWKNEEFIKLMTVECENCGKISKSRGAHFRWHGDNCKKRGSTNE